MTPPTSNVTNACLVNAENKACSDTIDMTVINKYFKDNCYAKNNCTMDFRRSTKPDFFKTNVDTSCSKQPNSRVFVQYTCEMTEGQKYAKYNDVLICTFTVLMIASIYVAVIYYARATS